NGLVLSKYNKTKGLIANLKPVESHDFESFKALKKQNIIDAIGCFKQGLKPLNFPDNYNLINSLESGKILSLIECITILKLIAESYDELAKLEQVNNVIVESMSQAIETYQAAALLIQRARKEITDDKSKIELNTLENSTFKQIISISYSAYSITNDLKYLELAFQN